MNDKPKGISKDLATQRNSLKVSAQGPQLLIKKPALLEAELLYEPPKSPKKVPLKKNSDNLNFGFNVVKLTKEQTEAATKLMQKEFEKEVPFINKRKYKQEQEFQNSPK